MPFKCQAGGSYSKDEASSSLSATTNTHFTFYGGHNGPAVAEMSAGRFPSDDVSGCGSSLPCVKHYDCVMHEISTVVLFLKPTCIRHIM